MSNSYCGVFFDQGLVPEPSVAMAKNLDNFVVEYIKDYDAYAACLRMGYSKSFAEINSIEFMNIPYVRRKIKEIEEREEDDEDDEVSRLKKTVKSSLLREAHYKGPGSSQGARVAALSALAKIAGLETTKIENTLKGGVMVVPAITNVDEWEKAAIDNQENLHTDSGKSGR